MATYCNIFLCFLFQPHICTYCFKICVVPVKTPYPLKSCLHQFDLAAISTEKSVTERCHKSPDGKGRKQLHAKQFIANRMMLLKIANFYVVNTISMNGKYLITSTGVLPSDVFSKLQQKNIEMNFTSVILQNMHYEPVMNKSKSIYFILCIYSSLILESVKSMLGILSSIVTEHRVYLVQSFNYFFKSLNIESCARI